jgi:hypothetical protein
MSPAERAQRADHSADYATMDFASRECHALKIRYRHRETVYHRDIVQPHAADGGKRDEVR